MKNAILKFALFVAVLTAIPAVAAPGTPVQQDAQDLKAAALQNTATGAANTAVTATIGAYVGGCIYVTDIHISQAANAAVTGAAGPAPIFTTTGLATNLVWWGDNSTVITGVQKVVLDHHFTNPLKVNPSTAFTIVTSAGQSTHNVRINVLAYAAAC